MKLPLEQMPPDDIGDRRVDADVVDVFGRRFYVSTVRLPDDGFVPLVDYLAYTMGHAKPAPYETMVFRLEDGDDPISFDNSFTERYATRDAAAAGHARIVAVIEDAVGRGREYVTTTAAVCRLLEDVEDEG